MMERRFFTESLLQDHPKEKMLFLAGPRQVGKTTLAQTVLNQMIGLYLNNDIQSHRKKIREGLDLLADLRVQSNFPMIVFDEIHKLNKFKSYLKGFYDENRGSARIWVTGSGRLDLYQKGGDSLLGRYFLYHIHPFTISDVQKTKTVSLSEFLEKILKDLNKSKISISYQDLLEFGGFPEPLIKKDKSFYQRWIKTRKQRLIFEDIRDLTRIQDLNRLEQLVDILPSRVGSPLSINSLREDIGVAFETIDSWIQALEKVYYIYTIAPYSKKITRAIRKEKKLYFWDWSEIKDPGTRFENFIVSHWKKTIDYWNDFGISNAEMHYIRDKEKREIDLVISINKKPELLIEIKSSDLQPSPHLFRFGDAIGCKNFLQIVNIPDTHRIVKVSGRTVVVASPDIVFGIL
jgi:uncharacterized protein